MNINHIARIQKYFCCGHCFGDLIEVEKNDKTDLECRRCGGKVFVTKTTGEIKTQKALEKDMEIKVKINRYKIAPFYNEQSVEQSIAELGF